MRHFAPHQFANCVVHDSNPALEQYYKSLEDNALTPSASGGTSQAD
jgi:hypothetical protein